MKRIGDRKAVLGKWLLRYLIEAPCRAVFATWCEVPQLHVQEIHQLDHCFHCIGDVPRLKITLRLLCQLSGNYCSRLSSFKL